MNKTYQKQQLPQDLHIHTTFSEGDSAVVLEQTVDLVAAVNHANSIGISDHIEYVVGTKFINYSKTVLNHGFHLGLEISHWRWVEEALNLDVEYYVYHCENHPEAYQGLSRLMSRNKPVIIAHPLILQTDLDRIPENCFVEISNRYVWRSNWKVLLSPYVSKFCFIISSDAHQPCMLGQSIARYVAAELDIRETIVFPYNQ